MGIEFSGSRYAELLSQLAKLGLEFDQRMQQAWEMCASPYFDFEITDILTALLKLNTQGLDCLPANWHRFARTAGGEDLVCRLRELPQALGPSERRREELRTHDQAHSWRCGTQVLTRMVGLVEKGPTVTCHHFCRALSDVLITPTRLQRTRLPNLLFFLGFLFAETVPYVARGSDDTEALLRDMPKTRRSLELIGKIPLRAEDLQYVLCLEEGKIVFRAASLLRDFVTVRPSAALSVNRALLTHFKNQFGAFTPEEVAELEEMIRNPKAGERDFQVFFERHPHFFRRWDYREVHPQVYLVRQDEGPLVPDFILTNPEIQQATVVELKLPKPKLIVHRDNRVRFAAAIHEARSQLLEYRDWFRERANRDRLVGKLGMEVLEPRLAVIIGRSAEFQCALEREKLEERTADVEVVTYDDILTFAKRRRILMGEL